MTAKEYLNLPRELNDMINKQAQHISLLRDIAQNTTVTLGGETVSHSRNVSSQQDIINAIIDAEKKQDEMVDALVDLKAEMIRLFERISDIKLCMVLELRDVALLNWEDVASRMKCCKRYAIRLHDLAEKEIENFSEIFEKSHPITFNDIR